MAVSSDGVAMLGLAVQSYPALYATWKGHFFGFVGSGVERIDICVELTDVLTRYIRTSGGVAAVRTLDYVRSQCGGCRSTNWHLRGRGCSLYFTGAAYETLTHTLMLWHRAARPALLKLHAEPRPVAQPTIAVRKHAPSGMRRPNPRKCTSDYAPVVE